MNLLKRIFRSYNAEKGKTLSDWRKRMLAFAEYRESGSFVYPAW